MAESCAYMICVMLVRTVEVTDTPIAEPTLRTRLMMLAPSVRSC